MSNDTRTATEGCLLKEVLRDPGIHLRWTDGTPHIAHVLTKLGVDKTYLRKVLIEALWSFMQDQSAARMKQEKAHKRSKRRQALDMMRKQRVQMDRSSEPGT